MLVSECAEFQRPLILFRPNFGGGNWHGKILSIPISMALLSNAFLVPYMIEQIVEDSNISTSAQTMVNRLFTMDPQSILEAASEAGSGIKDQELQ